MTTPNPLEEMRQMAGRAVVVLGLEADLVGVRLLDPDAEYPAGAKRLEQHRYCQAIMRARRGEHVTLDAEGIACPAAAAAFGFRPLPEGLRSGKGLVGFGIVAEEAVGRRMFEAMPALSAGSVKRLHLFPLSQATHVPDVIVVEDEVEKLMWINLAYLNATGGERVQSSTAILQATCVDSTIIPFTEKRLNFGYGCYGCRDATDLAHTETAIGFPAAMLPDIVRYLEYLGQKAIPASRSKKAFAALAKRSG
jgi:uncharacterized protein (DUF169 family)